jgi:CubicO group peptidase (beta-lactamase class C family)
VLAPGGSRGPVTPQVRRAMTVADLQDRIQEAVHELIDGGAETGVQVAVVHDGAVVADVAGGVADLATGCPVSPGTLF